MHSVARLPEGASAPRTSRTRRGRQARVRERGAPATSRHGSHDRQRPAGPPRWCRAERRVDGPRRTVGLSLIGEPELADGVVTDRRPGRRGDHEASVDLFEVRGCQRLDPDSCAVTEDADGPRCDPQFIAKSLGNHHSSGTIDGCLHARSLPLNRPRRRAPGARSGLQGEAPRWRGWVKDVPRGRARRVPARCGPGGVVWRSHEPRGGRAVRWVSMGGRRNGGGAEVDEHLPKRVVGPVERARYHHPAGPQRPSGSVEDVGNDRLGHERQGDPDASKSVTSSSCVASCSRTSTRSWSPSSWTLRRASPLRSG